MDWRGITMKLQVKKVKKMKTDKLVFQWEILTSSDIKRNNSTEYNKQYSLDKYFDLLAEIKPHKQELKYTKIFSTPFTLLKQVF